MNAKQVMQTGVAVVSPELSLHQFEEFLTVEEISGAPVVSSAGELLGIASKTDIVAALAEQMDARGDVADELTVADIMTRDVVTVTSETPLEEIVRILVDGHLHRVVVSDGGAIVGIITAFDVLRTLLPGKASGERTH